jgi:hypothetical protein
MNYKVVLSIMGIPHESEGETIDEALANLNLSWEKIKARGIITVSKGNVKGSRVFQMNKLRRMASNKLARATEAKNLEYLLKINQDGNNL